MLGVVYFGHTEKHSHVNEAAFDTLSGRHADTNVFVVLDSKHTRLVENQDGYIFLSFCTTQL